MIVNVLGVCGSPIKGGNTEAFLREALKAAETVGEVETELIPLAGKKIQDCVHCNWCLSHQKEGEFCAIEDDMTSIFPKLLGADGLLLATPVYSGRLAGYLANFIDRFRVLGHGNYYKGRLEHKVGGALAVSWYRHGGIETGLLSIVFGFYTWDIIPIGAHMACQWGGAGLSSHGGTGKFDREDKLGVLKDEYGLETARTVARRVVKLARIIKAGINALEAEEKK